MSNRPNLTIIFIVWFVLCKKIVSSIIIWYCSIVFDSICFLSLLLYGIRFTNPNIRSTFWVRIVADYKNKNEYTNRNSNIRPCFVVTCRLLFITPWTHFSLMRSHWPLQSKKLQSECFSQEGVSVIILSEKSKQKIVNHFVCLFECLFYFSPSDFWSIFKVRHVRGALIMTSIKYSFLLLRELNPGPLRPEPSALTIRPSR